MHEPSPLQSAIRGDVHYALNSDRETFDNEQCARNLAQRKAVLKRHRSPGDVHRVWDHLEFNTVHLKHKRHLPHSVPGVSQLMYCAVATTCDRAQSGVSTLSSCLTPAQGSSMADG